jgi:hypothetical protein
MKHPEIEASMRAKIWELIEATKGLRKLDLQSQADQELQRMQAMQRQQQENARLPQEQEMRWLESQS